MQAAPVRRLFGSSSTARTRSVLLLLALLTAALLLEVRASARRIDAADLDMQVRDLRRAIDRYRDDHGWYPADPSKDFNSDGDPEVLKRQLTWFTRDDGKPADRRDADYRFGPYLREFPVEPRSGSQVLIVDQDRARALSRLRADLAAGNGSGGWYYEAQTGNIEPNWGRSSLAAHARARRLVRTSS